MDNTYVPLRASRDEGPDTVNHTARWSAFPLASLAARIFYKLEVLAASGILGG